MNPCKDTNTAPDLPDPSSMGPGEGPTLYATNGFNELSYMTMLWTAHHLDLLGQIIGSTMLGSVDCGKDIFQEDYESSNPTLYLPNVNNHIISLQERDNICKIKLTKIQNYKNFHFPQLSCLLSWLLSPTKISVALQVKCRNESSAELHIWPFFFMMQWSAFVKSLKDKSLLQNNYHQSGLPSIFLACSITEKFQKD